MKKIVSVTLLFCALLGMLYSCTETGPAADASTSNSPEASLQPSITPSAVLPDELPDNSIQPSSQPSSPYTIAFRYTDKYVAYVENGKRGLMDSDGNIVLKAEYDAVSVCDNEDPLPDIFFAGIATESSKPIYKVFDVDGNQIGPDYSYIGCSSYHVTYNILPPVPPYLAVIYLSGTVIGKRENWLLDAEGKPYHDLPYDEADLSDTEFHAIRDGNSYRFTRDYKLIEASEAGVCETYFNGKYQRYIVYDRLNMAHFGLLDGKGNMLFEPVYCWIEVPFDDIILLYEGAYQGLQYTTAKLVDSIGGVYCSRYNHIAFSVLEDGRYIGVAFAGNGSEGFPTYDENGEKMPLGYWFVNCYGNPVSERYNSIQSSEDIEFGLNINDENDTFTVTTDSSEQKVISAKDILLTRKAEKDAAATRYTTLTNERIICETEKYSYIEVSESIDDGDELTNKTQDYIYKVDHSTKERTLIYKSPDHTRYFNFRFMHDKWIYVTVYNYFIEPYVIGFARIDTETDTFEMLGSSGQHGLIYYKGSGYYFWRGEREDRSDAGIYKLDPATGESTKIAELVLPLDVQPSGSGDFYQASGNQLFFVWGLEGSKTYFVADLETGTVKRT